MCLDYITIRIRTHSIIMVTLKSQAFLRYNSHANACEKGEMLLVSHAGFTQCDHDSRLARGLGARMNRHSHVTPAIGMRFRYKWWQTVIADLLAISYCR
jgi:hypothetical protein